MRKNICAFILMNLLISCNTLTLIDELKLKGDKYFAQNSKRPYSGGAVAKFEDGNVSAKIDFKNGIPSGSWYVYGFDNEIVQDGEYVPFSFNYEGVSRVTLYKFREGNYHSNKLFIIAANPDKLDTSGIGMLLRQFFLEKSIKFPGDTLPEIQIVPGELSYLARGQTSLSN